MNLKSDENKKLWESFVGPEMDDKINADDMYDVGDNNGFEDNGFDDGGLGDEPEAQSISMEFEPAGPVETHEVNEVLVAHLKKLSEYSKRLYDMKDSAEFEDWMASAITIAATYVDDVWHRLDAKADFANTGFEQADFEQPF